MAYWNGDGQIDGALDPVVEGTILFDSALSTQDEKPSMEPAGVFAVLAGVVTLFGVLSAALVLLITIPLLPKLQIEAAKYVLKYPWYSLSMALVYFICMPIIAILLMFTVIGIPLGVIVLFKFIASLLLARVLASLVLVRALQIYYKKTWNVVAVWALALLGYVALHLVNLIPVVGWIVSTGIILAGFGALMVTGWEKMRKIV